MARHKQVNWQLPDQLNMWEQVNIAVLMDIRDELQTLNRLLACPNFVGIPSRLAELGLEMKRVRLNTTKKRRKVSLKAVA